LSDPGGTVGDVDDQLLWARIGHRLGRDASLLVGDPAASSIFESPGRGDEYARYVQWHGEPDDAFYAEASSGLYDDVIAPAAESAALRHLGWTPPRAGLLGPDALNWSRGWTAPVDLYAVVRLTVATLRDVFRFDPHDLWQSL